MGPNGTGKSTLASVIAGKEGYEVTDGNIFFNGKNLLNLSVEDRAREGIFIGFQYPVEIPGVSIANFMRTALNEIRQYRGLDPLNGAQFLRLMNEKKKVVELTEKLSNRSVNEGFSGGEKKRNEIFQMAMLEPKLAILDETDSRRPAHRCQRRQPAQTPRQRHHRHHPLPAPARLYRARCGARPLRGQDC